MIYPLTLKLKRLLNRAFFIIIQAFDFGLLLPPNGLFSPVSRGGKPVCCVKPALLRSFMLIFILNCLT
jgi:hypothetical protein